MEKLRPPPSHGGPTSNFVTQDAPLLPLRFKKKSRTLTYLRPFIVVSLCLTLSVLLYSFWSPLLGSRYLKSVPLSVQTDPASQWKDDVWPIRPATAWDISTDYPYPRLLKYDVQEGTWLRLDVHPKSGDVVFDMLGDIYCIPGSAYTEATGRTRARPILLGIPYDSDPHFSPSGDRLVFRSDAELGVENIWVVPWTGCNEMDLAPREAREQVSESIRAPEVVRLDDNAATESIVRKRKRLLEEGRHKAVRVTNETYRWVSDARFHPSGSKVIATKWYTSSRSLGAGEGWEYLIPNISTTGGEAYTVPDIFSSREASQIEPGSGTRVVGRTLPPGWAAEQYGDQQIGPEQFIWQSNDSLIFSKNVIDTSQFTYSKDVHSGIYAIFSYNMTTKTTERLVDSSPGGASRPELSRDGKTLAFVRRVRDKEALVLKDLETGTIHNVWHGLTYDLTTISAPMGTYPSFAFTPSDDAVIIWAAGQIYCVPLSVNAFGEKVASTSDLPSPILFTAHIQKRLAETRSSEANVVDLETRDTQRVYAFKELRVDDQAKRAVFQAAGVTYVQELVVGKSPAAQKVPVLHADAAYYSPSFIHGADNLILHARWSNTNFTAFELANLTSGVAYELEGLSLGRYYSPVLCECSGAGRQIAFIKTGGDLLTGDIIATAGAGLYLGSIALPHSSSSGKIKIHDIRFVPTEIDVSSHTKIRFIEKNTKLLVQQESKAFIINLGAKPNDFGEYPTHTLVTGKTSTELAVSPRSNDFAAQTVAFVDFFQIYVVSGDNIKEGTGVWSKPANATKGIARVSLDGGHDIIWSRDGKKLFWFLGPFLHSLEVSKLAQCYSAIRKDASTFGISCIKNLVNYQEVNVEYFTDIKRLKREAAALNDLSNANSDVLVISNATLLTMDTGFIHSDLISGGVLVSRGGVIEFVGSTQDVIIPTGATIIDAHGGFVVPGFIDVHAHWSGFDTLYPATSWELETFLAYGVTTLHNPSADTVDGQVERSRVESGQLIGPRIFTVGTIVYGAGEAEYHQDIADMDEARAALLRIKAEGGPASLSYKNYNLPSRASRQRLLLAARNLSMLCVPEGGMNQDWDLTYIIDGMTTVEHALPVSTLYDDILILYALSGTGATPTHIVNYGGAWGEQFVWATEDVPNDSKLRRFTRHDLLEGLTESTARPANSYALFNTSASVAKMVERGLRAHIGAHGEPPLGLNYHAEMFFTKQGGLSNYEVVKAATSSAASTLGLRNSLGTLTPGKLADVLIYAPSVNLLQDDIKRSREIKYVVRGGRVWDAESMNELWPVKGRKQDRPIINAE